MTGAELRGEMTEFSKAGPRATRKQMAKMENYTLLEHSVELQEALITSDWDTPQPED